MKKGEMCISPSLMTRVARQRGALFHLLARFGAAVRA